MIMRLTLGKLKKLIREEVSKLSLNEGDSFSRAQSRYDNMLPDDYLNDDWEVEPPDDWEVMNKDYGDDDEAWSRFTRPYYTWEIPNPHVPDAPDTVFILFEPNARVVVAASTLREKDGDYVYVSGKDWAEGATPEQWKQLKDKTYKDYQEYYEYHLNVLDTATWGEPSE